MVVISDNHLQFNPSYYSRMVSHMGSSSPLLHIQNAQCDICYGGSSQHTILACGTQYTHHMVTITMVIANGEFIKITVYSLIPNYSTAATSTPHWPKGPPTSAHPACFLATPLVSPERGTVPELSASLCLF